MTIILVFITLPCWAAYLWEPWIGSNFPAMIASMEGEHRDKYAAWFDPYTAELCTGEMEIRFHAICGHTEYTGSGKNRKSKWVETHNADELWGPTGCGPRDASTWETSHARERSAEPLTAKSAGSLFEVAWRNASGDPYVTQSRSILEVRVFLSLSCADSETSNKLAADWESFKLWHEEDTLWHEKDTLQDCWASVDVKTTLGPASQFKGPAPFDGRRIFALSGVPCFLSRSYY